MIDLIIKIRSVGRYIDINDVLHTKKEAKQVLEYLEDITDTLRRYIGEE